jgi:hypothetical protein
MYLQEADELAEGQTWDSRPVVVNNNVRATGNADVTISAEDLVESHESCAFGEGLGLALGIASLWYPCILIEGNTVEAHGDATADVTAEAVHAFDPTAIGGAAGIGIGIVAIMNFSAEIIDNETLGTGKAFADIGATENDSMANDFYANAAGGSLGLGEGILVSWCFHALVQGNIATGKGDAETNVVAVNYIPLGDANACAMSAGIGKGIAVVFSFCAEVIECNIAAGIGNARVSSSAQADFADAHGMGIAASLDIVIFCVEYGVVNYNSMVDTDPLTLNGNTPIHVMVLDAGLLKIGPYLNAKFNWWNDPTGPSGMRPGHGEPLIYCGGDVCDIPWLYVPHTIAMDDQTGYFVYPVRLSKGLNTLSTPFALEEGDGELPASRTWADIKANSCISGMYKYAIRWNEESQLWVCVADDDVLSPLDAWYIYMKQPRPVWLMINSDKNQSDAMPIRTIDVPAGGGWCLISSNPQYDDLGMPVGVALSSIEQTPDGTPGYTQVISPIADSQDPWIYTPDMSDDPWCTPWMSGFRGYWVWMENTDILVGFGFTPIWVGPF